MHNKNFQIPLITSPKSPSIIVQDVSLLAERFRKTRQLSLDLCQPLETEDYVVQPVEDVSPPKWHLGHTTWFFEALILKEHARNFQEFHPDFSFMFNSYYESKGDRVMRPNRGFMSRPSVDQVLDYREYVNNGLLDFLSQNPDLDEGICEVIELGIQHEQQHQELLVTDIKYVMGHNPLFPIYRPMDMDDSKRFAPGEMFGEVDSGNYEIGHGGQGFCYDNEQGVHNVFLHSFRYMDRLVTNGEYLEFIEDGSYRDFRFWLSDAWDWINKHEVTAPLYWHQKDGVWHNYTLNGFLPINTYGPVTHVSFFEADAFARWKGKRLLTEFEWEVACRQAEPNVPDSANFVDSQIFHPSTIGTENNQFYGDVWEWTNSAYLAYPYFKTREGVLGEYNGKFMVNQMVLRGGSCATSRDHIRPTYRNFFHPHLRWQFTGIRLAEHC